MIDMKKRASVEIGNVAEFATFLKKTMGIPVDEDETFANNANELFTFLFPFAHLVVLDMFGYGGSESRYYAAFRCEEDAVEFKLKYL